MGDFRFHFEKSDNREVSYFSGVMSSLGFSQFVSCPTHKKGHILDIFFAHDFYFKFDDINSTDYNISDHFPIFFDVPIRPRHQSKKQIFIEILKV